jgi:hypothetical protein
VNLAKTAKIKEILASDKQVEVVIIAEYQFEEDALDHEFHLIDNNPTLTNAMPDEPNEISVLHRQNERVKRLRKLLHKLYMIRNRDQRSIVTEKIMVVKIVLVSAEIQLKETIEAHRIMRSSL